MNLNVRPSIKTFLGSINSTEIIDGIIYQKVKIADNYSLLLRSCDNLISLTNINFETIGIFNETTSCFEMVADSYEVRNEIFSNDREELRPFFEDAINKELNELIYAELYEILSLNYQPSLSCNEDIKEKAASFFKNKTEPQFEINTENVVVSLENLVEYFSDKKDFAYEYAENLLFNNQNIVETYLEYINILAELKRLKNNTPIELELESKISALAKHPDYKSYNLVLDYHGKETYVDKIEISKILSYPFYAIKQIYWGRKLLFSLDDYDENDIAQLKENVSYNIKGLENSSAYLRDEYCKYVNKKMFKILDFALAILKCHPNAYDMLDVSLKENISFISNYKDKIGLSRIVQNVSESFILQHKSFFIDSLKTCDSYAYSYFPENIWNHCDFIITIINKGANDAISYLNETNIGNSSVQDALDTFYETNPNCINLRKSDFGGKLKLIQNETTLLNILTSNLLSELEPTKLNDISFMSKFLEKIEKNNNSVDFLDIYRQLIDLKENLRFCMELLKRTNISDYGYNNISENITKNKNFQRLVSHKNKQLLYHMDDDIKREFVLKDASYLEYYTVKKASGYNRRFVSVKEDSIPDELFIDIAKSSKMKPSNLIGLKKMTYKQSSDKKLAKKLLKITPLCYQYFATDVQLDISIARFVTDFISIIPYLPAKNKWQKSLFDNDEIMRKCLKINPRDFSKIPTSSRKTGPAILLDDFEFIKYAISLYSMNAYYLDSKSIFRENSEIAKIAILDDISLSSEFANKLFKDDIFIFDLLDAIIGKYEKTDEYNTIIDSVNEYILPMVTKKIKNTKEFKDKFPMFS